MAKTPALPVPTEFKLPELKLPKFDLDAWFTAHKANLATVREAQMVLTGAVQAIAEIQYGYIDEALTDTQIAVATRELPKAETFKAAGEKFVTVAKEIVELSLAAQKRVFELFSSRGQASVEKLKAVA